MTETTTDPPAGTSAGPPAAPSSAASAAAPSTAAPSTSAPQAAAPQAGRLPAAVYLVAVGIFCLGTSEFMIAGLLPQMAVDLGVTLPAAGMLITAFALGMMVGGPVMAIATLKYRPRASLLTVGAVFALSHLVPLVTDTYAVVLVARVLAAVACAAFWAVGAALAVRMTPSGRTARAMAVLIGGLTLANVIGVPAGSWIGQVFGWRAAFLAVALATVGCLTLIAVRVPRTPVVGVGNLRQRALAEVRTLRTGRLWLALATTVLFQAAVFCAFSYLAPLITDVAGLADVTVPMILLIFGVGSLLGVTLGGRFADRNMLGNVLVSLAAMAAALLLVAALAGSGWWAAIAVFVFGATSFSISAALSGRVFAFAGNAPTLAAGVNVSAFNLGNAIGPWAGGMVIGAGLGFRAPIWAALGLTALALGIAGLSAVVERRPAAAPTPASTPAPLPAGRCPATCG